MNFIKHNTNILVALMLVLLTFGWFAPPVASSEFLQVDFWFVWFFAMTILALPVLYLEVALAKRSKKLPLIALPELTRQADAARFWRIAGWLGVFMLALIAVGMADVAAMQALALVPDAYAPVGGEYTQILWLMVALGMSFALSFVRIIWVLLAAVVLGLIAVGASGINIASDWQVTGLTFKEWQSAASIALIGTGLGSGAYWQLSLGKAHNHTTSLWLVLPVWLIQIVAGIFFALFQGVQGELAVICYMLALVCGGSVLLALLKDQLSTQSGKYFLFIALIALALMLWALPLDNAYVLSVMIIVGFTLCLVLAVFSGWHMKVSHLRKALQFDSEVAYNVWRVAVRFAVPLAIILAVIGLVMRWV